MSTMKCFKVDVFFWLLSEIVVLYGVTRQKLTFLTPNERMLIAFGIKAIVLMDLNEFSSIFQKV